MACVTNKWAYADLPQVASNLEPEKYKFPEMRGYKLRLPFRDFDKRMITTQL